MFSESSSPGCTISSASTMQIFPAAATSGLKFLAVFRNIAFPSVSALYALTSEKSGNKDSSSTYLRPLNSLISLGFLHFSTSLPPGLSLRGNSPV